MCLSRWRRIRVHCAGPCVQNWTSRLRIPESRWTQLAPTLLPGGEPSREDVKSQQFIGAGHAHCGQALEFGLVLHGSSHELTALTKTCHRAQFTDENTEATEGQQRVHGHEAVSGRAEAGPGLWPLNLVLPFFSPGSCVHAFSHFQGASHPVPAAMVGVSWGGVGAPFSWIRGRDRDFVLCVLMGCIRGCPPQKFYWRRYGGCPSTACLPFPSFPSHTLQSHPGKGRASDQ